MVKKKKLPVQRDRDVVDSYMSLAQVVDPTCAYKSTKIKHL